MSDLSQKEALYNVVSLDTICGALCYAIGIDAPKYAAAPNEVLKKFVDDTLEGKKADRLFMFNPDAIGMWIQDKYPEYLKEVHELTQCEVPLCTVMPSVTPVCFGTMYTGAQPAVHGIQEYAKPVIQIDTFFDALVRAGKKVALLAQRRCSMAVIYQERPIDYFIYPTIPEVNAKAAELIVEDQYDVIITYNGNYDAAMHHNGPEAARTLAELRANDETFAMFYHLIQHRWQNHNTLYGFAMDHGCHEIDEGAGSHGLDMPEDINIRHYYGIQKKQ